MERRYTNLAAAAVEIRAEGEGTGMIHGYGAVYYDGTPNTEYQLWPGMVERIMPGAFSQAVNRDDVRALFNHDTNMVLGRKSAGTLRIFDDNRGLRYEIDPGETTVYRDVAQFIKRKDVQGSSFAFMITDEQPRKENGIRIREIRGVELFDVGPVTFPAYESTSTGVRMRGELNDAKAFFERMDTDERRRRVAVVTGARARLVGIA
jgi:HK97 family phage prohead protease